MKTISDSNRYWYIDIFVNCSSVDNRWQ